MPNSTGFPLPTDLGTRAKHVFGVGFEHVRLHDDHAANEASRNLSADAFATHNDVYFAQKLKFEPDFNKLELLGHELSHVVHQRSGLSSDGFHQRERALEQEADLGGKLFKENVSAKRALTSASGSGALDSAWIQRSEPKGKPDDDFDPKISNEVGPRKPNRPEDVAKIQRLLNEAGYNVGNSGVYDAATEKAIRDLQDKIITRDKKSWVPDGIVTPGKATWTELAKEYIVQAPETSKKGERPRTRFPIAVDVMIGPRGSTDKAMQYDAEAAVAAGLEVIQVKGMKGAAEGLKALYDQMLSVDNLYVSSHGNYDTPFIRIGSQKITAGNVNELAPLRNLLSDDTTLVLTGCHVGGGRAPDAAKKFVTSVADTLDVVVYASKSWVRSGTGVFDHGEAGSVVKPGTWISPTGESMPTNSWGVDKGVPRSQIHGREVDHQERPVAILRPRRRRRGQRGAPQLFVD